MTMTDTPPRAAGRDTFRSDRGLSSVTHYWDDDSQATVSTSDYAGMAITYRPGRTPEGRLRPERGIWWEDHTPTREWLAKQRPAMPDHIWEFLTSELPDHYTEGITTDG